MTPTVGIAWRRVGVRSRRVWGSTRRRRDADASPKRRRRVVNAMPRCRRDAERLRVGDASPTRCALTTHLRRVGNACSPRDVAAMLMGRRGDADVSTTLCQRNTAMPTRCRSFADATLARRRRLGAASACDHDALESRRRRVSSRGDTSPTHCERDADALPA